MKVTNQSTTNSGRIENKSTDRASGATEASKNQRSQLGKESATSTGSLVEISDNARLMQRAVEVAKQAPEIHTDKVASLKKSIKEGTYKVDARKVADRLVEDHFRTDFGKNSL